MKKVHLCDLGVMPYQQAWDLQEKVFSRLVSLKTHNRLNPENRLEIPHYLFLVTHPPVFTLGKSGDPANLLLSAEELKAQGIEYIPVNRGGDITYHGPGSIVGYPLIDLDQFFTDIHKYLRYLEEMVILTLKEYGIESGRIEGLTGVWLEGDKTGLERKICAYGIRASRWITMHGWSLNVNTNLNHFAYIVPCGIDDKTVTSMAKELNRTIDEDDVKTKLLHHFSNLFDVTFAPVTPDDINAFINE